ncbi:MULTISPECIES: MBL fold metallo-hydrolase [Acidiplasma]|nr:MULTISPECIES: MBL fold metallo-hydrolase [Acidiplasma]KJE49509.1 hypothetical protein TZ01_03605 [Acidiplasma sp. MBA-1]KPV47198.1 hypothetical protein SE19_02085 [Acidiplasma aeolicum]WMT54874.1 MAG: MBL fold metallo-hydrolase [Acidiplasma sp.]
MQITSNVQKIDGTVANCYLIKEKDMDILIDAGTKSSGKKIISFFEKINERPDYILITHSHMDHIGGLLELYNKFKPVIYVPGLELKVIQGADKLHPANMFQKIIYAMFKTEPVNDIKPVYDMKIPFMDYYDTPGHTIGSVSYLYKPGNILFSGDAAIERHGGLIVNKKFSWNYADAMESLNKINRINPDMVCPGHGNPVGNKK